MDNFDTYLEEAFDRNFVQGEYNNLHRDLYKMVSGAIKLGANTFSITSTHIIFGKNGTSIQEWDFSSWQGICSRFREGMQTILRHDEGVRTHVQVTAEGPDSVSYSFVGF